MCVEFANTGRLTGALLSVPGLRVLVPMDPTTGKTARNVVVGHVPTEELDRVRQRLRDALTAIANDTLIVRDLRKFAEEASQLKIEPQYDVDQDGNVIATYNYFPPGASAAIAYGIVAIADPARPLRTDLKQCRLPSCGKFFFSSDSPAATGRDRSRYCTPEHMNEAQKATSAQRTRRWRERKAQAAKHK